MFLSRKLDNGESMSENFRTFDQNSPSNQDELQERANQIREIEPTINLETSPNELISRIEFIKETPQLASPSLFQNLLQMLLQTDSIELQKCFLSALDLFIENSEENCNFFFEQQYCHSLLSFIKNTDEDIFNYELAKYGLSILAKIVKTSEDFSVALFDLGLFNDLMQLLILLTTPSDSPNFLNEHRTILENTMEIIKNFFRYPILKNPDAFHFINYVYHLIPNNLIAEEKTGQFNQPNCISAEKSCCLEFIRMIFTNIDQYSDDEIELKQAFIEEFNDEHVIHWILEQLRSNHPEDAEDGIDDAVIKSALDALIAISGFNVPEALREECPGGFDLALINDPTFLDTLKAVKFDDDEDSKSTQHCNKLVGEIFRNIAASHDFEVIKFLFEKSDMIKFVVSQLDKSYAVKWEAVFFFLNLLLAFEEFPDGFLLENMRAWLDDRDYQILESITEVLFNPLEENKKDEILLGIKMILEIGEQANGYDCSNHYAQRFQESDLLELLDEMQDANEKIIQDIKNLMEEALQFDQNQEERGYIDENQEERGYIDENEGIVPFDHYEDTDHPEEEAELGLF